MRHFAALLAMTVLASPFISAQAQTLADLPADNNSPVYMHTTEPQKMILLNTGLESLEKRLEMIQSAKKSIEVEFFIYNLDNSARIFTQALVAKAQQGVKIRLLVDHSIAVFKLNKYFASQLKSKGIEVRYYNNSMILALKKMQFRSHRKLLVVDDKEAITGGRNVATEYFDLKQDYNFLDTDIYIKGSIVKRMRESFELFWNSEMTKEPGPVIRPEPREYGIDPYDLDHNVGYDELEQKAIVEYRNDLKDYLEKSGVAKDYITPSSADIQLEQKIKETVANKISTSVSSTCTDTTFAADYPGIGSQTRVLGRALLNEAMTAKESLYIQSPYFVIKQAGNTLLETLLQKNVKVNILTNSLFSTDAFYTVAAFFPRITQWLQAGANVWIYDGTFPKEGVTAIDPEVADSRWGIHSKTAVLDGKTVMVGTFNVDPRSANLNAEMAVICRNNPVLADSLIQTFNERAAQSAKLDTSGHPQDGRDKYLGAPPGKIFLYWLTGPLSNMFDFLL
jgi:putative cardiolipin synthase